MQIRHRDGLVVTYLVSIGVLGAFPALFPGLLWFLLCFCLGAALLWPHKRFFCVVLFVTVLWVGWRLETPQWKEPPSPAVHHFEGEVASYPQRSRSGFVYRVRIDHVYRDSVWVPFRAVARVTQGGESAPQYTDRIR